MGKVFGIFALIFGILGLLLGWAVGFFLPFLPYGELYISGAAIVFGIIGIIADDSKGMAIAGLILGIIGLILGFVITFFLSEILDLIGFGGLFF